MYKGGEESLQRSQQNHKALQSIITSIGLFALLALVITGFAGWYIYHNLGSNLTAISHAMTRLARGEKEVSVPAQQRRDELGELARAFNVFARNTASLEHTSRLLKEKSTLLKPPFTLCAMALPCSTMRAFWWCGTHNTHCCWGWHRSSYSMGSTTFNY